MSLSARQQNSEQDFPMPVKDSLTVLPYKAGGTTTLGTTDIRENLVLPSDMRRFENDVIAAGTHTGGNNVAILTDADADFLAAGVEVGDLVNNTTDSSSGTVVSLTATTITVTLAGGTDDDFDTSDVYTITAQGSHNDSKGETIRKVTFITDLECYIKYDGDASAGDHDVHLAAGEAFSDSGLRIIARISFINVQGAETPELRWHVWGI